MGVAVQGLDEQWDLAVALDAAEGSLGVEHVRGGAAQHHLRLLVVSVLARRPLMPRRATVNISASPSLNDAAAAGVAPIKLRSKAFRVAPLRVSVIAFPHAGPPGPHRAASSDAPFRSRWCAGGAVGVTLKNVAAKC
jgi:hypothetical protein